MAASDPCAVARGSRTTIGHVLARGRIVQQAGASPASVASRTTAATREAGMPAARGVLAVDDERRPRCGDSTYQSVSTTPGSRLQPGAQPIRDRDPAGRIGP